MPITIRNFRNTDLEPVCSIWNAHYAESLNHGQLSPLRLELYCLAKPYFDPRDLLIVEDEGRVAGFLHFAPLGNQDGSDVSVHEVGISALCVMPGENENRLAAMLLTEFEKVARARAIRRCYFKPLLPNCAFYLGLGPGDSMVGAVPSEVRVCNWLSQSGFKPTTPTCQWELDLMSFKPPIDRMQIQVRRAAQVNRQVDEPELPWWQACVLGHTEISGFQLTHRKEKRVVTEVLFWALAPELQSTPESTLWLWPPMLSNQPLAADHATFLLAESLREFQKEGLDCVRTVSLADETNTSAILRKLGFQPHQNGFVFQLDLKSPA